MSDLDDLAAKATLMAERLGGEWERLEAGLTDLDHVLARIPGDGAVPRIPLAKVREGSHYIGKLGGELPRIAPTCRAAGTLVQAAADWRRVADTLAPPVTDGFDVFAMAAGNRGWESTAAEHYGRLVDRYSEIAANLATLLRHAATAMEDADDDIHGWLAGMLGQLLALGAAVLGVVGSWIALVGAVRTWLTAYLAALEAIGAVNVAGLAAALATIDAAVSPIVGALVILVASLLTIWGACEAIRQYLAGVAASAADRIRAVQGELRDSTPWPMVSTVVPGKDQWM